MGLYQWSPFFRPPPTPGCVFEAELCDKGVLDSALNSRDMLASSALTKHKSLMHGQVAIGTSAIVTPF